MKEERHEERFREAIPKGMIWAPEASLSTLEQRKLGLCIRLELEKD